MARYSLKIHDEAFKAKLAKFTKGLGKEADRVVKNSAAQGMRTAIKNAPKDNGDLQRSIQLVPLKRTGTTLKGGFDVNIKYAAPQNYGFVHNKSGEFIPGKFFMEKGYDAVKVKAEKEMKKAITKFLSG